MDYSQPPALSWSFSSRGRFETCRRKYFYHRFWMQDQKMKWKLYEMRCITKLATLRGHLVHEIIADALATMKSGGRVALEDAKGRITEVMRRGYIESAKRMWHRDNRPPGVKMKDVTNLLEHYYGVPDADERVREHRRVAWACIENLFGSELWREVETIDPETWKAADEDGFPSFDLDGIKVYAKIDFAHENGEPTIIDWKTGGRSIHDRDQLILYSLFGQWQWGWEPTTTKLAAVYLQPELEIDEFRPTPMDVDRVADLVRTSFHEMLELEPAVGSASIEDFPINESGWCCRWCRFQGVCEGAKNLDAVPKDPDCDLFDDM